MNKVYMFHRKTAHLSENGTVALCGLWEPAGFWGTGTQAEYEKAAGLPLCKRCLKANGGSEA